MVLHTTMLVIALTQGDLWRSSEVHLLTQLYATRNINAGSWLNALMGGLPHHGPPRFSRDSQ